MKVFQIGFNRCGTTSLYLFFKSNKHKSLHWKVETGLYAGRNIALLAHENMWDKNKKIFNGIDDYIFYSDMEFVSPYLITNVYECFERIDHDYPGSKFILNIRDKEDWINSRLKHGALPSKIYSAYAARFSQFYDISMLQVKKLWRKHFDNHIKRVKQYFARRPNQLLIFELGKTDISEVVRFLSELKFQNMSFPISNINPKL